MEQHEEPEAPNRWDESHLMRDAFRVPPWPIYRFGVWLLSSLQVTKRALEPPPSTIFDMVRGAWRSQILYTVAALNVADVLGQEGPQTAHQLAETLGVCEERLYRVLRAAVQIGLFQAVLPTKKSPGVKFKNNKRSALLRDGHPNCLKNMVLHMTDHNKPAWDVLHWATSTGDLAFEHTHQGLSEFEWLKANPAEEDKFSKAMKEVDSLGLHVAVVDYSWNRHGRIIDIGGAYGSFLASILAKHPKPRGVLFDQSQVVKRAEDLWKEDEALVPLTERVDFCAGDFFQPDTLPTGQDGDAYMLRLILHDWNNEDSVAILSSIRQAMGNAKARLLIVETTMGNEFKDPLFQRALMDVHMMVCLNGHERTVPEWKALLEAAGFKFSRLIETRGVFSLVEAVPAPIPKHKAGSEGEGSQDVHINLKHKYLKDYGVITVNLDQEPEP